MSHATRAEEDLDFSAISQWFARELPEIGGEPEITQYSGGASNWTYRLHFDNADLVLRRAPAGTKAAGAHDMPREYRMQSALAPVFDRVPRMRALCEDAELIGSPFYVMNHVPGIILRKSLPRSMTLDAGATRRLCTAAIDTLAALHAVDATRPELAAFGKGSGYARRQIDGWSERYRRARTWNVPKLEGVMRWLDANVPADTASCVIHNDFRFDNLVLDPQDPTHIVAVLDWELATIGDPLMDLGSALAYWVEADDDRFIQSMRRQPTHLPGMMSRREVMEHYAAATGRGSAHWAFYETYGLFRLAVIVQQIYYRYHHHQTRNPAFRNFWIFVHYLGWRCRRIFRAS